MVILMKIDENVQIADVWSEFTSLGETYVVEPSCGGKSGSWLCITHETVFENQFMKDTHISDGKVHVMVWICPEHGPEIP